MHQPSIKLLLIEDNPADARLIRELLAEKGGRRSNKVFNLVYKIQISEAAAVLVEEQFDLVLLDLTLPDSCGLETLRRMLDLAPDLPVVVLSGLEDEAVAIEAVKLGAQDYLVKGYLDHYSLLRAIIHAVERKQIQEKARQAEQRYRDLFEEAPVMYVRTRAEDGTPLIEECNQLFLTNLGYTRTEVLETSLANFYTPESRVKLLDGGGYQRALRSHIFSQERSLLTRDGQVIETLLRTSPELDSDGSPRGTRAMFVDISERKQAEQTIQRRNRELDLLNKIIAASAANLEPEEVLEVACYELARTFGLTQAAAVLLSGDKSTGRVVAEYRSEGQPSVLDEAIVIEDNPLAQYLMTNKAPLAVTDAHNDPRLASIRDILYRRGVVSLLILPLVIAGETAGTLSLGAPWARIFSTEEVNLAWSVADQVAGVLSRARLGQDHKLLSTAVEKTAENVMITGSDGTILYVNPTFEHTTGYTRAEVIGQNPRLLKSGSQEDELYRELWATIEGGQVWRGRFVNKKKGGGLYTEEATITPVRDATGQIVNYVAVGRDISQELQREEQYRQAQKMEAVGRLAGGVAHDFNNLLTVITGYSELLLARHAESDPALHKDLEQIKRASERAAALTRQLLAFSRKQVLQPKLLDLNDTMSTVGKMLQRLIGEDIDLITIGAKDLGTIKADPGQIEQIIMNLAVNARDAMPRGGKLTIETKNVYLDDAYASQHIDVEPGWHVMLAVSDTGGGMDAETQAKIFEPFFTTKGLNEGTGLGLATVYGIVRQSGGNIWVYSELGQGTTFKVYLPLLSLPAGSGDEKDIEPLPRSGSETILVVEDEEIVRELICHTLCAKGYTVLEAGNGQQAIQLCHQYQKPIHLLLTDMVMPGGLGGHQLSEHLLSLWPDMRVLYISGYPDHGIVRGGSIEAGAAFIQKPFVPNSLARKVRELLDV